MWTWRVSTAAVMFRISALRDSLHWLVLCVSTLRTPLAAGVCEEGVVARRPRQDVVEGAAVALVPEEGPHPRDVVAVAPQPPQTLRVSHQVTEVSVAAHGHHEPLKPRLCVNA